MRSDKFDELLDGAWHWLRQLALAIDQLLNVLITPFSKGAWADETLCSRAWRMDCADKPWGMVMRPVLDFLLGEDHCEEAFESERLGRQLPPEARP